jgi:hypothetical protein
MTPFSGSRFFWIAKISRRVAVGTRISPRPPHRSRRALLTHRTPPSGQTSCDKQFSVARRPTRSHHSDRRGISARIASVKMTEATTTWLRFWGLKAKGK